MFYVKFWLQRVLDHTEGAEVFTEGAEGSVLFMVLFEGFLECVAKTWIY